MRPLNYRTTQLAMAVGNGVVEGAISFGIAIGLGLLFFDIRSPDSAPAGALFAVSVLLGFVTKLVLDPRKGKFQAAGKGVDLGLASVNADLHASEDYRRAMVGVFAKRALVAAVDRA